MASAASASDIAPKSALRLVKPTSTFSAVWRRLRRNKPAAVSAVIVILLMLVAIFAPALVPYGYDQSIIQDAGQSPIRSTCWARICWAAICSHG